MEARRVREGSLAHASGFHYIIASNDSNPRTKTSRSGFTGMTDGRILGIDPGLNITGYGVVERDGARARVCEAGVVRSTLKEMAGRLREIHDGVGEIIEQYKPRVMVVEQLYAHYKHPRTAILMGHARGAILLAASLRGVSVISYSATRIKKTITGHGRASKEQVQRTIQRELGLIDVPEPPDVADALAGALCHFFLAGSGND